MDELEFGSKRELLLFTTRVVKKIKDWHLAGEKFYIGNSQTGVEEIEFELFPDGGEDDSR